MRVRPALEHAAQLGDETMELFGGNRMGARRVLAPEGATAGAARDELFDLDEILRIPVGALIAYAPITDWILARRVSPLNGLTI
jgi:hypothetical protein